VLEIRTLTGFWNAVDMLLRRNHRLPPLKRLRKFLRKPYHWLMSFAGGLPFNIGGVLPVRIPARYLAKEQEFYEAENYAALKHWIDGNAGCWIIDVGCSLGYFTCASLFHAAVYGVVGIDADQESLGITKRVCCFAPDVDCRLTLLNCLITDQFTPAESVANIRSQTARLINGGQLTGDPQRINYVNADTSISYQDLPRISLDDVVSACVPADCPLLIKVDVEGAETMVLEGAAATLATRRPTMLLSVHPGYLPRFNSDCDRIRRLLQNAGYRWTVLAVDHEEHWLCEPLNA
jgi:FkbM family methyltransferase